MPKYCHYCGKEVTETQDFCLSCGISLKENSFSNKIVEDKGHIGWSILSFFLPMLGLILFLIWKEEQPKNAKKAGIGALIGVITSIILTIIVFIILVIAITTEHSSIDPDDYLNPTTPIYDLPIY